MYNAIIIFMNIDARGIGQGGVMTRGEMSGMKRMFEVGKRRGEWLK